MSLFSDFRPFFEQVLFQSTGRELQLKDVHFLAGGCINQTVLLRTPEADFFLKWNEQIEEEQFAAEAEGLALLRTAGELPVPEVLGEGSIVGKPYLLLEYLESGRKKDDYWEALGRGLAALHRHTQEHFGLDRNNFIGRLAQRNTLTSDWLDFFVEHRLEVQLQLALYQQHVGANFVKRFRKLYPKLKNFFPQEVPALLHGDLWSGNVHTGPDGVAWLIDPAVYYGHREMELAFTQLFGGFDTRFYAAYREAWPLEPGFAERAEVYNLYPLLVHVNLFGSGYLSGIERTLNRFV